VRHVALLVAVVCGFTLSLRMVRAQTPAEPAVRIVSPQDGSYVKGPSTITVDVSPVERATSIIMYVDGRQVCSLTRVPFSCEWDGGPKIVEHQIRTVVNLTGGGRVVRTAVTRPLANVFSMAIDNVQVTATITRGPRYVRDLSQASFHLFEDDVPQQIVQFATSDLPLDLVVAVDLSNSVAPVLPTLRAAVREFLGSVSDRDRVTLLGFNDRIFTLTRRETDAAARAGAVDRMRASGGTALYDVMLYALEQLDRQAGRRTLVVFTDGQDEGSAAVLEAVQDRLKRTDATVFIIAQGRGLQAPELRRLMRGLAEPTGGRAVFTDKIEALRGVFADIREELSSQYLLGYVSSNEKRDGTWRRIKVAIDGPGQVHARDGYEAPVAR
jgi:Ca-activated chloride channel family protein